MARDSKKDMFDLVLTKEISRFSRDTLDSISYAREFLRSGVGIFFESDNINTLYPDSELRLTIMASIAQDELRKLSERVRFGMKRSIEQEHVLGNNNIYGYNKNKCTLEINESEAIMVKRIFELYATGNYGFKNISKILFEEGYKTKTGNKLNPTALTRMIRNPKYKGYYCTNTVARLDYKNAKQIRLPQEEWKVFECKDKIPPIVSEELWNKCNSILKARSDSFKNKQEDKTIFETRYPFTCLIYCGEHDEPVTFHRRIGKKSENRPTWACYRYIRDGVKSCQSPILVEKELYEIMKSVIKDYINNKEEIVTDLVKRYEELNMNSDYEKKIQELNRKINEIKTKKDKLLELAINGYIQNEEFASRNEALNQEMQKHVQNIKLIENQKDDIKQIKKNIEQLNIEISNELEFDKNIDEYIKLMIERIIVHKVNGNRKHVKLEIFFKLGEKREIDYEIGKKKDLFKKSLLSINHLRCGGHRSF